MKAKAQVVKSCPTSKYHNSGLGSQKTGGNNSAVPSMQSAGSKATSMSSKKY